MNFKAATTLIISMIFVLFGAAIYLSFDLINSKRSSHILEYDRAIKDNFTISKESTLVSALLEISKILSSESVAIVNAMDCILTGNGFVQISDSSESTNNFQLQHTPEFLPHFYKAVNDENLRVFYGIAGADYEEYPQASSEKGKTGDIIRTGDIVKFIGEPIPSGDALWIEIAFQEQGY